MVDVADVGVTEGRRGASLLLEPRNPVPLSDDLGSQHLERYAAIELPIAREIDFTHAADPEEANDRQIAELDPGRQRHDWSGLYGAAVGRVAS